MRTIKASEVVKGMRVRVVEEKSGATVTTEGVVTEVSGEYAVSAWFGSYCLGLSPDHPVTVLAEPEPEWVEGAWYWVQYEGDLIPMRRLPDGWQTRKDATYPVFADFRRDITVLGRVLIVDWPGDDVAREVERTYTPGGKWITTENTAAQAVADAIRTQGGVR